VTREALLEAGIVALHDPKNDTKASWAANSRIRGAILIEPALNEVDRLRAALSDVYQSKSLNTARRLARQALAD
jgi:hypothetical protein